MQISDFFKAVENDSDMRGLGIDNREENNPAVLVEHLPTKMTTRLPAKAVEQAEWDTLSDIICGRREPVVLQHMTRVVGYYSRVENWNRSKLGELKDRHKGQYAVAADC